MRTTVWTSTLALVFLAAGLSAEESAPPAKQQETPGAEVREGRPVRKIKVLEDPYDLASYYRAPDGAGYGYGFFGYGKEGDLKPTDHYPIASYYRARSGSDWYGYARTHAWRRGRGTATRTRSHAARISDFYLLAPTFLTPVGPAAGEYLADER